MGLYEFLRYIVVRALAGEQVKLLVLRDVVVRGDSPSIVASRYGISKHQVRGYVLRISDNGVPMWMARKILDAGWKHIVSIEPIVEQRNGTIYCKLCRQPITLRWGSAWFHIERRHGNLVEHLVAELARRIREELRARRCA